MKNGKLRLRFYIKNLEKWLKGLLAVSILYVFFYEFYFIRQPQLFSGAYELGKISNNIFLAIIPGIIIYFFTAHIPKVQREQRRRDEIILHLERIRTTFNYILSSAFRDILELQEFQAIIITGNDLGKINSALNDNNSLYRNFLKEANEYYHYISDDISIIWHIAVMDKHLNLFLTNIKIGINELKEYYNEINSLSYDSYIKPPKFLPINIFWECEKIDDFISYVKSSDFESKEIND